MGLSLIAKEGEPITITHSDGSTVHLIIRRKHGHIKVHFIADKDIYRINRKIPM